MRTSPAPTSRGPAAGIVDVRQGFALDVLPRLAAERREPFDLVFIDADKPNAPPARLLPSRAESTRATPPRVQPTAQPPSKRGRLPDVRCRRPAAQ
jgi:hypothetical protein